MEMNTRSINSVWVLEKIVRAERIPGKKDPSVTYGVVEADMFLRSVDPKAAVYSRRFEAFGKVADQLLFYNPGDNLHIDWEVDQREVEKDGVTRIYQKMVVKKIHGQESHGNENAGSAHGPQESTMPDL
jgi:hypothetical protein